MVNLVHIRILVLVNESLFASWPRPRPFPPLLLDHAVTLLTLAHSSRVILNHQSLLVFLSLSVSCKSKMPQILSVRKQQQALAQCTCTKTSLPLLRIGDNRWDYIFDYNSVWGMESWQTVPKICGIYGFILNLCRSVYLIICYACGHNHEVKLERPQDTCFQHLFNLQVLCPLPIVCILNNY